MSLLKSQPAEGHSRDPINFNKGAFMRKMRKISWLFFIALFCFCGYSEEKFFSSEVSSQYDHLPAHIETARLGWRIGLLQLFSANKTVTVEQSLGIKKSSASNRITSSRLKLRKSVNESSLTMAPFMVGFQAPVNIKNQNLKWLFQIGAGWALAKSPRDICNPFFIPKKPEPPFDTPFFLGTYEENYKEATNIDTCRTKSELTFDNFPYLVVQPGLALGLRNKFGLGEMSLSAGALLAGPEKMGAVGSLLFGWSNKLEYRFEFGFQALYLERFYYGLVISFGSAFKIWREANPFKENLFERL